VKSHFTDGKTGTRFKGAEVGVGIKDILTREGG